MAGGNFPDFPTGSNVKIVPTSVSQANNVSRALGDWINEQPDGTTIVFDNSGGGTGYGAGTEYVLGDKSRLIRIVLNGLQDPIEINGETFQNIMAPHAFLSDQQISDVLTFVRQSFGNNAETILPEEVASERNKN